MFKTWESNVYGIKYTKYTLCIIECLVICQAIRGLKGKALSHELIG